jgi:hypothetical protein
MCYSHALGDIYRCSFYGGLLSLTLAPYFEMPLMISNVTWVSFWRQAPLVDSAENPSAEVVDFTAFPFSLVLR